MILFLWRYITALHFAVTTMTTVGYGDITPSTLYETAFAIVAMLISCGIFAYTFNSLGSIVDSMTKVKLLIYLFI